MTDLSFLTFDQLLEAYFERDGVEAELRRRYARNAAILVVDFTEMTHRTDARGIVYALALVGAAERAMWPSIAGHGGAKVKQVADTIFAVFDSAEAAVLAALDANQALTAFNTVRKDAIRACIGVGYGEVLLVPGRDVFGPEVNRAFVLGEDVAKGGEVLVTEGCLRALGTPPAGVGVFRAPADRETEAGFPFHVVGDYRS